MHQTGANVIRVPVHPEHWEQEADYLWRYLDPMVAWAGAAGMYAIIDLHFIGNVETGAGGQMVDTHSPSKEFTLAFWRQVAAYFKGAPHVIFEIFNEPESISASDWRRNAGEIVAAIRETGAEQVVIVGGVEYSRDLAWVVEQPVARTNIAYTAHIYPSHAFSSWDSWYENAAERFPVVLSEWGWIDAAADQKTDYLVGTRASYGEPLIRYLDEHGIGWVACWYDDEWLPPMFTQGFSDLTDYGIFVESQLNGSPPQSSRETPMTVQPVSRRSFLKKGCLIAGAAGLALCGGGALAATYQPNIEKPSLTVGDGGGKRILIAYATRAGSTAETAVRMGELLAKRGLQVDVRPVASVTGLGPYSAVVAGSAIRTGAVLPEMLTFLQNNQAAFQQKPLSLFILCMTLAADTESNRETVGAYLAPVRAVVKPASEGLFAGVMDMNKLKLLERLAIMAMDAPSGDFRRWDQINAWTENAV